MELHCVHHGAWPNTPFKKAVLRWKRPFEAAFWNAREGFNPVVCGAMHEGRQTMFMVGTRGLCRIDALKPRFQPNPGVCPAVASSAPVAGPQYRRCDPECGKYVHQTGDLSLCQLARWRDPVNLSCPKAQTSAIQGIQAIECYVSASFRRPSDKICADCQGAKYAGNCRQWITHQWQTERTQKRPLA